MSGTDRTHRPHGLAGYLNQEFGPKTAEYLVSIIFEAPAFRSWVLAHSEYAEWMEHGLNFLVGTFELPGDSAPVVFINRVLEDFATKFGEALKQLLAHPNAPASVDSLVSGFIASADSVINEDALVAVGLIHNSDQCPTVAALVAQTTPRKPRQGPDGKSMPLKSWARIEPMKFGAALTSGAKPCPHCYPTEEFMKDSKTQPDVPPVAPAATNPAPAPKGAFASLAEGALGEIRDFKARVEAKQAAEGDETRNALDLTEAALKAGSVWAEDRLAKSHARRRANRWSGITGTLLITAIVVVLVSIYALATGAQRPDLGLMMVKRTIIVVGLVVLVRLAVAIVTRLVRWKRQNRKEVSNVR